jgi:hypothetical protein
LASIGRWKTGKIRSRAMSEELNEREIDAAEIERVRKDAGECLPKYIVNDKNNCA